MLINRKKLPKLAANFFLLSLVISNQTFAEDKPTCQLEQPDCDLKPYSSLIIPVSPHSGDDKFITQESVSYRCSIRALELNAVVTGEVKGIGNLNIEAGGGSYVVDHKGQDQLLKGKIYKESASSSPHLREFIDHEKVIDNKNMLPNGINAAIVITNQTNNQAKASCSAS